MRSENLFKFKNRFNFKLSTFLGRKKTWFLLSLAIGLLLGFIIINILIQSNFLIVQNIVCILDQKPCPKSVEGLFDNLRGVNLVAFNKKRVEREIFYQFPAIKVINIARDYPGNVIVTLKSKIPIAVLVNPNGINYLIDSNGQLIFEQTDPKLSAIFTLQAYNLGQEISHKKDKTAFEIFNILNQSGLFPQVINANISQAIEVELASGELVIFSEEKEITKQIDALNFILHSQKLEAKPSHTIDLRFENPLIK